jgi:Domain of unknown function (DUF4349)
MSATDAIGSERLEALLRGDVPHSPAETRRAALLADLRGGVLHAPEPLRARVLAAGPAPRRLRVALPSRRLALAVVPAALALAVVAAVVHGVIGSGPGTTAVQHGQTALARPPVTGTGSGGPATGSLAPSATAPAPALGSGSRLQHVDATLALQVADTGALSQATTEATRIAGSLGGWAQSVDYGTGSDGSGQAQLDLRLPVSKVQTAIVRLSALGTLLSQQLDQQDLQQQLAAQSAHIAQLRRRIAALEQAIASPSLPDAQRVLLRIQLSEARRSLAQSLNARKGTIAAGATANVSLTLSTKPQAGAVVHQRGRLGRMLHSAAGFLALEGTVALYALVVLSPLLALAGGVWALVRARRRRDERRLLAA